MMSGESGVVDPEVCGATLSPGLSPSPPFPKDEKYLSIAGRRGGGMEGWREGRVESGREAYYTTYTTTTLWTYEGTYRVNADK